MPDPTSRIRFGSVFPKTAWTVLCKTHPGPIWMAWSAFVQTHLVQQQAGVQESSGPVSDRTQPARYQFPTFSLGCILPQTARVILWKTGQPGPELVLAVSGFGQTNPVRKQASVQDSSGSGSDANRIRHVYWAVHLAFANENLHHGPTSIGPCPHCMLPSQCLPFPYTEALTDSTRSCLSCSPSLLI